MQKFNIWIATFHFIWPSAKRVRSILKPNHPSKHLKGQLDPPVGDVTMQVAEARIGRLSSSQGVKKGKRNQKRRNKNKGKSLKTKKKKKGKMGKKKNKGKGKETRRKNKGKAAKKTKNKDKNVKRNKKKAKNERARKERKGKKEKKKKQYSSSNSTSCMNPACLTNINKYMQQVRKLVKNFERQHKRILRNKNQAAGKAGKKSEFAPYILKLREVGGGNASSLTCHGEATGAANLQKLYNNMTNCEKAIHDACNATIPSFNHTHETHVACITLMEEFGTKVEAAYKATESADKTPEIADDIKACKTWESAELAKMSSLVKKCGISEHEKNHTDAKKKCTTTFGMCRKDQDLVSKYIAACSPSSSAAKVKEAIAHGLENKIAADAVSAKINATLAATTRSISRAETTPSSATKVTCAAFATKVGNMAFQVRGAPLFANLGTMLINLATYTVAICSADEKTSLGNARNSFTESKEFITLAVAGKQAKLLISTWWCVNI